jgi:hypothetical protein
MSDAQGLVNFVMDNRSFFGFLVASAGYIAAKVKGARKDERIERQAAALEGVARAVEEFQAELNRRTPLAVEDPKALKKAVAYRVSRGREELDDAIARMEATDGTVVEEAPSIADTAKAAARAVLP